MTTIIKKSIGKYFRLIDFYTYDKTEDESDSSSDHSDKGIQKKKEVQFMIQIFGLNEQGDTVSILVNDVQPFFYVKVGDNWSQGDANSFIQFIKGKYRYLSQDILSAELIDQYKLYGFTGGKMSRFVKLTFRSNQAFQKVKGLWFRYDETSNQRISVPFEFLGVRLQLYESTIPSILRYFHIKNISPSGWIVVNTPKCICLTDNLKETTCTFEYICSSKHIKAANDKETRVPYKICSFDIEASSSHGDFPIPVKSYKRLATNILDCFQIQVQTVNDQNRQRKLLEKMILSAFGYDHYDGIDLVYPIVPITKDILSKNIEQLLHKTMDISEKHLKDDSTIESLFEKMKESSEPTIDSDEECDEEDYDDESTVKFNKVKSKVTSQKKAELKLTILEILHSAEYNREQKITILNKLFYDNEQSGPFPKLEGDKVTFIGSTFMRYGETEPYLNHCLVVNSCDPVENAVIETVKEEKDLLLQWTQLIQKENPDIIIGYNIFGFDYEFMYRRAQENGCQQEFLQLSRKKEEISEKSNLENTKIKIASGEYDLRYPKMMGRLQIDMYSYFRRDYNLSSYKLDDVAGQFISDSIRKTEMIDGTTKLYSKNLAGLHKGDYIHIQISNFSSDYYAGGEKLFVLDIQRDVYITELVKGKEVQNKYNVIIIRGSHDLEKECLNGSLEWTMAKDDVTPQDIFRLANGSSADRAIVAKYCIQDCNLVHHLMNKIDVITGYIEMSSICSVPISYLVFRGQGIKLTSYVAKKCREKNTLMPDLEKKSGGDGYEGAIVLPPKCSMYIDNPVACVDYSSLYPSSMISQNYSHDSKVWSKEYDLNGKLIRETGEKYATGPKKGEFKYDNLPGYDYIDIEFDTFKYLRPVGKPKSREVKTKVGKKICRWAQLPENKKSIMPSILTELLDARSNTRKKAKTESDPFMQNILDKRQLGYKVTANSLYGQCGARTSTFFEQDVAASTTATGRMMIIYAKRMIEEVYGDRIYDTVSHGPVKCRAEYVYGDSVANYTPVKVRVSNGPIMICSIESLAEEVGGNYWITCEEPGKQKKEYCELYGVETWSEQGWTPLYRIIRHKLAAHKKMFRIITDKGLVDVTDDHSLLNPEGLEISPIECSVGTQLLHHSLVVGESIETNIDPTFNKRYKFYSEDHVYLATLAALMQNHKIVECENDVILLEKKRVDYYVNKDPTKIQSIRQIQYQGYVYDLTTKNHHFAAGIGDMIVHNTDSVFFTFNLENPNNGDKIRGKPALEMTIEIAQDVADLCTSYLKPPMALAYEKSLMPFILLSKKRYVGMLYEEDPNKGKLKYMGLVLKRRDNCDLVKDVYGGVLQKLMDNTSIQPAIDFLYQSLNDLIQGKIPMDKLTITKSLRSDYKNPHQIAHRVLADRIAQRDPGNKPKPGDRIRYAYIVQPHAKLQGEKIETPEFIIDNKLKIDYTYYITNQLMKPLQQLFGLAIEQIWEMQNKSSAIKTFHKDMIALNNECDDNLELFMKKKEKYTTAKIKTLLFDKFLMKIFQQQNGIRTISDCFSKK